MINDDGPLVSAEAIEVAAGEISQSGQTSWTAGQLINLAREREVDKQAIDQLVEDHDLWGGAQTAASHYYQKGLETADVIRMYIGPKTSHDRFVAGEIVTHCQFITDTSSFVIEYMHPDRLRRFFRMLEATRPKYPCEECKINCPGPVSTGDR